MKPSIPSGTRDMGPEQASKRKYIFEVLEHVFKLHGFQPIETPAMENLNTLTGKYGDEGDQLIYKILNNGDFLTKLPEELYSAKDSKNATSKLSEKALRYDLTVPFARFVVMNRNNIHFPFKRYQIQPVWRADRPQKGRYREFYQCDVDIIGSNSLLNEVELIFVYAEAFKALNIKHYAIRLNNRKLLQGIADYMEASEQFSALTIAIDKLDKIGLEGVMKELGERGFEAISLEKLNDIFSINEIGLPLLQKLKSIISSEVGMKGIEELEYIYTMVGEHHSNISIDLTLARGLTYYTGTIFEVVITDPNSNFSSSVSGGGRYDDLTGIFDMPGISGVGISFGADRIYDVMDELNLFPADILSGGNILICCLDDDSLMNGLSLASQLRATNISCELYPSADKMKKQLTYANNRNFGHVIIIGESERLNGLYSVKNMKSGEQLHLTEEDIMQLMTLNK
jgi:histidyl-tRNA synthetase